MPTTYSDISVKIKAKILEIRSLQKKLLSAERELHKLNKKKVKVFKKELPEGYFIGNEPSKPKSKKSKAVKNRTNKSRNKRGEVQREILDYCKDGKEHTTSEIRDHLASKNISADNINPTLVNMKKAKKLVSTGRGKYKLA